MAELTEQEKIEIGNKMNALTVKQIDDLPANVFAKKDDKQEVSLQKKIIDEKSENLVGQVFNQAIVEQVKNNADLQGAMLDTAKQYTKTKMEVIKNTVDTEDKKAYFDNKKDACSCFGYEEATTEKWAVKYMNLWHNIMNAIWITIGWVTYAPITFIGKKLKVIIKQTWLAIVVAILLYLGITIGLPLLLKVINH